MASENLDIPHGVPDDYNPSPALDLPLPSLDAMDNTIFSPSHTDSDDTDNQDHLSRPTPILRSAQNFPCSSSHASDSPHSPHPSSPHSGSISSFWLENSIAPRDKIAPRDNSHEHGHCRKRNIGMPSIGNNPTKRDIEYNSRFRLNSDVTSVLPASTRVDDAGSRDSRLSFVTRFFRKTVNRVRRSSSSRSGETSTGSDETRNNVQKGDDVDVIQKQCIVMKNLEERLKATNWLHGEAVALSMLYESGTVASMRNLRATGKVVHCCL